MNENMRKKSFEIISYKREKIKKNDKQIFLIGYIYFFTVLAQFSNTSFPFLKLHIIFRDIKGRI